MQKRFLYVLIPHFIATMLLLPSVGCKEGNPEGRENVGGKITLNGKTIDDKWNAAISFIPSDGRDVTDGGGGQITQGKYFLTGAGGVKPGKYKVKLFMTQYYDVKTGEPSTENTGDFDSVHISMIPKEFNDDSTMEFEVLKGKNNVFNYDIVTDYVPDKNAIPKAAKSKRLVE